MEHLGKLPGIVPLSITAQPLNTEYKEVSAKLSIKIAPDENFKGNWDILPEQVAFNAQSDQQNVKIVTGIPQSDSTKPVEGMTFVISPDEMLVLAIPLTVNPVDNAKGFSAITSMLKKKPAPLQKMVLVVFAVEKSAAALPKTALSPKGKKFWAEFFFAASQQLNRTDITPEQQAFYARFSQQLSLAAVSQASVVRASVPAPTVPAPVSAPVAQSTGKSANMPSAAAVKPNTEVKSSDAGVPAAENVASEATPQAEANPESVYQDMPTVVTDVQIPNIDMAAERAKTKRAQEEAKQKQNPRSRTLKRNW